MSWKRTTMTLIASLAIRGASAAGQEATPAPAPSPTPAPTPPPAVTPTSAAPAVKLTPYGFVSMNGYYNSSAANNTDIPMWAVAGAGSASASARQTRLGVRIAAPPVFGSELRGAIELDFFGGFPAVGIGDNFPQPRLRLAYARLDRSKVTVLVGQDWAVFAPQNPTSLACAGTPCFAASGNAFARLPQLRFEYRSALVAQIAVLAPSSGDFNSAFLAQPSSGMASKVPYFQARLARESKNFLGSGKPGAIGISGHYGRSRVTPTGGVATDIDSAAGAIDLNLPLGRHLTLVGEAITGMTLAGFQAGVFQGINPDAIAGPDASAAPHGIATRGAWGQLGFTPGQSRLTLYAGYGFEDPDDDDLRSATVRDWRLKNEVLLASLIHRASANFSTALEYRHLRTKLLQSGTHETDHVNLAATLSF